MMMPNFITKIEIGRAENRIDYLKRVNKGLRASRAEYKRLWKKTPKEERWNAQGIGELFRKHYTPKHAFESDIPYELEKPYQATHFIKKYKAEIKRKQKEISKLKKVI
jgi:hypothetical protein